MLESEWRKHGTSALWILGSPYRSGPITTPQLHGNRWVWVSSFFLLRSNNIEFILHSKAWDGSLFNFSYTLVSSNMSCNFLSQVALSMTTVSAHRKRGHWKLTWTLTWTRTRMAETECSVWDVHTPRLLLLSGLVYPYVQLSILLCVFAPVGKEDLR